MNKYILAVAVGVCGLLATAFQTHAIDPYIQRLSQFAGLQTQAQELGTLPLLTLSAETDSALEQAVVYRPKQFASAAERAAKEVRVWATAYTSHPMETDDTPFITASGSRVRDGVAAANFLPMGTKFKLPNLYGDKVFTVEDRMNARYNETKIIDLWFADRTDALHFGRKSVVLELL
jgi:3D (Asp-Asp-Asp) domain-containing protein